MRGSRLMLLSLVYSSFIYSQSSIKLPEAPPPIPKKDSSKKQTREDDEQLLRDKGRPKNLYPGNDATEPSIQNRTPQFEFSIAN